MKDFAERISESESAVTRLEKSYDGVCIGTLTMVCPILGEVDRISDLLDVGQIM